MDTPIIRDRSNMPLSARKIIYISPEEIIASTIEVVQNSIAIEPMEAVPLIAKMFGFNRVNEEMKNYILQSINKGVQEKKVLLDGELLKCS